MTEPTTTQETERAAFRAFVDAEVLPHAARFDKEEAFADSLIRELGGRGYLAPWLPKDHGGSNMDMVTYGLLHEEIGRACAATRSLLTAHGMVAYAIQRCGSRAQKRDLLPTLASGASIGAFAVTEPEVGSDAAKPRTTARSTNGGYALTGEKKWITFGQRADLFLVLAMLDGAPTAFLVARDAPGLEIVPVRGMLGTRGARLADLRFDSCEVPKESIVGKAGVGFSMVAATALDHGRYSVAWGCVGMVRACLEACVDYTSTRRQFGTEIMNHQLVRRIITDMLTSLRCAESLCRRAGALKAAGDPDAFMETMLAKYYASTAARRAADDAVQLHGANGCSDRYPVERFFRDSKIMEIIEGSSQILQHKIADFAYQRRHLP